MMFSLSRELPAGLLVFCALLISTAGCGGSDINCGPNTTNESGTCRPDEGAYACGPGTSVGPDDECIVDDAGCGPNLVFNQSAGRCVPDREECRGGTEFDPESGLCEAAVGCGENTTLESGVCRPDTSALCGSGAVRFDPESEQCVVSSDACGEGATLSAQGTCVSDITDCADGLALSEDGRCEPTDEICSEGMTFDADQQLCLPSTRCQQDDVVLNAQSGPGICVSPAKKLAENADTREQESPGTSHNDPTLGGNPADLGSISQGSSTTFAGTIAAPSDRDGDGDSDQDRDGFTFEADAGTWIELSVQSLGLPAPWFKVVGPSGFERSAPLGRDAARQLILPYDGNYTVLVTAEVAAPSVTAKGGPFGNDGWEYVGELAAIQPPTNNAVSLTPGVGDTGEFPTLDDNVYRLDNFSSGELVRITANTVEADADGLIQIWSDSTTLSRTARVSGGDTLVATVPSGSAPLVVVDWSQIRGKSDSYAVTAEAVSNAETLGSVSSNGSASSTTRTINAGSSFEYAVRLPGNHVVEFTHSNSEDEGVDLTVRDALDRTLAEQSGLPVKSNLNSAGEDDEGYLWVESAGLYTVEVETDDQLTNHEVTVNTHFPTQIGNGSPGTTLTANVSSPAGQYRSNWFVVEATQPVSAGFTIDASATSGNSVDFDTALFDLKRTPHNLTDGEGELRYERGTDSVSIDPLDLTDGRYLVKVGLEDIIDSVDVTADFTTPSSIEQEPNDTAGSATALTAGTSVTGKVRGAAGAGRDPSSPATLADTDYYGVTLSNALATDTTGTIRVASPQSTANAWSCSLTSPTGASVDSVSDRDAGCLLQFPGDKSGTYTLKISAEAQSWRRYQVTYRTQDGIFASEPNQTGSDAVTINLTNQQRDEFGLGRISAADPVDRFETTIPSAISGSPELVTRLEMTGPDPAVDARLQVLDDAGDQVGLVAPGETLVQSASGGDDFEFAVTNARGSVLNDVDGEYRLWVLAYEPDISKTNNPGASIPDSNPSSALDTINVSQSCSTVSRVTLDVTVTGHTARTYMAVVLESPSGTKQTLLEPVTNPSNHVFEPLSGNIPFDYPPSNPLDTFHGTSGSGDWDLTIYDTAPSSPVFGGTLDAWTLNLSCQ